MRKPKNKLGLFAVLAASVALLGSFAACGGSSETQATGVPLPDSAFRVEWGELKAPAEMKVSETAKASVTVTNTSDQTWPDPKTADPSGSGAYAVRLAWRWRVAPDQKFGEGTSPVRGDLQKPLAPGESATFEFDIAAPGVPGDYTLHVDLVQELVGWFEGHGAATKTAMAVVR